MTKKQIKITVQTARMVVIRSRHNAQCTVCGKPATMLTVQQTAAMAGVDVSAIYHLLEAGTLHFSETSAGRLVVCAAALRNLISNQKG